MPGKDIVEKTLESYNVVFADILNGLLFHGRSVIYLFRLSAYDRLLLCSLSDIIGVNKGKE